MALRRPFAASRRSSLSSQRGSLLVEAMVGAIVKFRGPVGTVNGTSIATGYRKDYEYNDRLRYREPPYFLDPVQASWRVAHQNEQVPATAEPEE